MPLSVAVGRARVIEISDSHSIRPAELRCHGIRRGERLLFKTRNSPRMWRTDSFIEDFVSISPGAARFLARRDVALVGIDYLSIGSYRRAGRDTHLALLQAGVWIVEGLDLSEVTPGRYDLICLPLRIDSAEGAPARVILRPAYRNRPRP